MSKFNWPNGTIAAVSLAYDDALDSQLDNAIPALDHYGFKASFYLTLSSPTFKKRISEWKSAALSGHELGNHTIHHACQGSLKNREWVDKNNDLDNKSVDDLVKEVKQANVILKLLDGKNIRTFTVPCLDHLAGGKNYVAQVQDLFIGIKAKIGNVASTIQTLQVKNISVIGPVNLTGDELITYVKQAKTNGTMINFTFHGVGGDYLSISNEAHQQLLQFLADNKTTYWVDTFRNISLHLSQDN
jgi:peptidoglycan/xylan/chitin deacetylase (PgdA/CDA1 family)